MGENVKFSGCCPYCKRNVDFFSPTDEQTIKTMGKMVLMILFNRASIIQSFIGDNGKLGRCSECNEQVLRCPKCYSINRHEYHPTPCPECGKEYSHP